MSRNMGNTPLPPWGTETSDRFAMPYTRSSFMKVRTRRKRFFPTEISWVCPVSKSISSMVREPYTSPSFCQAKYLPLFEPW